MSAIGRESRALAARAGARTRDSLHQNHHGAREGPDVKKEIVASPADQLEQAGNDGHAKRHQKVIKKPSKSHQQVT